jgi:ferrochelatase
MLERAAAARGEMPDKPVAGSATVGWYKCPTDCCPNLRQPGRPSLCEAAT